jgi:hypothetical protein
MPTLLTAADAFSECPVRIINQFRLEPTAKKHIGVDFRMCDSDHVVAAGDGFVLTVKPEDPSYTDPEYTGGNVVLVHHSDAGEIAMMYLHLQNIRVHVGQQLHRGEVIADFWDSSDGGWVRHVHVMLVGSDLPLTQQDPLQFMRGCLSQSQNGALVYPIEC